jgi:maleylpyruvate isomerase
VRTGQDRPAYASAGAREDGIEQGAGKPARELATDLAGAAMALRTVARQLPDEGWQVPVRMLDEGAVFPAAELLTRRLVEVELHHCDLGAGYGPAGWPPSFAALELAEPMRSWRQDRLSHPAPDEATALTPRRAPAPWRPGRPLPGSWLGTR